MPLTRSEVAMKAYEIELKRTSYVTVTVHANSEKEAEDKLWAQLEHTFDRVDDFTWELESIEEIEDADAQ
jgi:hypothetical protein